MFISFNLVRQSISTLIVFNGLFFLTNKNYILAIFLFITSFLFHFSSIFIVFFTLFIKLINTKVKWYLLFFLGIAFFIYEPFSSILFLLPESLKDIVESSINVRLNTGFGVLFYSIIGYYFYTFLNSKLLTNDKFLYHLLTLYIVGYTLFLFSTQYLIYNRITIFFQLCLPFLFAKLSILKPSYPIKKLINKTFLILFLLIFIRELINISTIDSNNLYYNYNFFITLI
jgi:Gpi18-like mannosyltransferase